tara:strand:+ start:171 stop:605 length:435 start_codon:yes stop_codon:yes gene_type:complete
MADNYLGAHGHYTSPGIQNVGSYQSSGWPWISGSGKLRAGEERKFSFPMVTKNVTVIQSGSDGSCRVHFASTASGPGVIQGKHYVSLNSHEDSYTFNVKCKEIYISCVAGDQDDLSWEVVAELTNIPTGSMFVLTGSGITEVTG